MAGVNSGAQYPNYIIKNQSAISSSTRPLSFWAIGGSPSAGAYDTTLNGLALSAPQTGQIPWTDPNSGNAYLARMELAGNTEGTVYLCDRLWHNGGYDVTSIVAQNSTTPAWPARDIAGSTNGDGVMLGLEISALTGAGTPTVTVSYTNQAGTAGQTATNIIATSNTAGTSSFYNIGLQAGDTGVRSVQSLTLSATWTSGTMNLVAYRPIAALALKRYNKTFVMDALTGAMPRLYNGSVPFFIFYPGGLSGTAVVTRLSGKVHYSWG